MLEAELTALGERVENLEMIIQKIENRLQKPFRIFEKDHVRGLRYAKPSVVEYFVITSARMISLLNSMFLLYRADKLLEWRILARIFFETAAKQKYVTCGVSPNGLDGQSNEFLAKFFSDNERVPENGRPKIDVRQGEIHKRISAAASRDIEFLRNLGLTTVTNEKDEYARAQSALYLMFSYDVHGRYPEAMDLFDFDSLGLQMRGVRNVRDYEIEIEVFSEIILTAEKSIRYSILKICHLHKDAFDPKTVGWALGTDPLRKSA